MYHVKSSLILCLLILSLALSGGNPSISAKNQSWIEENKGQHDSKALFIGKAPGLNIYFFRDSIIYQYYRELEEESPDTISSFSSSYDIPDNPKRVIITHKTQVLNTSFSHIECTTSVPQGTYLNYFYGNNPDKWVTRLPRYSSLSYKISNGGEYLKFFCSGDSIFINGNLDNGISPDADNNKIKANPVGLLYSGFLSDNSRINSFDIDNSRNVYVTGETSNHNFPITSNAIDTISNINQLYLSKFNPAGDSLLYSSFIVHNDFSSGNCIKLDPLCKYIYIAGHTNDSYFPITQGVVQSNLAGEYDGFVICLTKDGDSIICSTYIGGINYDIINDFIFDSLQNLVLTGIAENYFPTTAGCYQPYFGGPLSSVGYGDIFICKLTPLLDSIAFSTYIGGSSSEGGIRLAQAADGGYYMLGASQGQSPITPNSYDTSFNGGVDIYICKLSINGDSLLFSTYIGDTSNESARFIKMTTDGIYVCGYSRSADFPVTPGAYDITYSNDWDMIIFKLSLELDSLLASTYIGGLGYDVLWGLCLWRDHLCFTGTASDGYPLTPNALSPSSNGDWDMVFGIMDLSLTKLKYSTFFGGGASDVSYGLIVVNDSLYIYGLTKSFDFPITPGCYNGTINSNANWAGCYSIFSLNFTPEAEFTIPNTICLGTAISPQNNSFWEDSLSWTFGDGDSSALAEPQHTYLSPGTYIITLIVTNAYGSDTLTRQITVLNKYLLNYHKDICQGDSIFLHGNWQHLTGVYTDSLQTLSGCDSIIVTSLTVNPVYQTNYGDTICKGDSAWLAGSWQFIEGIYTDNLQSVFGCDSVIITQLAVQPLPLFSFPIDTMICEDQQLLLDAGIANMYYQWSTGDTTQSILITPQSGVYSITVTNKWECSDTASINVETVPMPVSYLSDSIIICQGEEITLDAGNCPNCTYNWSEGSSVPAITISQKGTYIVIIKNTLCTLNDTIEVSSCARLEMPNVFTPNNDGKNDRFLPKTYENIEQYKIEIFNRWGSLIYKSSDISEGWDGRYKGQECSSGTYFYNARYKGPGSAYSEKEETLQGVVTLLR